VKPTFFPFIIPYVSAGYFLGVWHGGIAGGWISMTSWNLHLRSPPGGDNFIYLFNFHPRNWGRWKSHFDVPCVSDGLKLNHQPDLGFCCPKNLGDFFHRRPWWNPLAVLGHQMPLEGAGGVGCGEGLTRWSQKADKNGVMGAPINGVLRCYK